MSKDLNNPALKHAARAAKNGSNVVLYSQGPTLILVVGAKELRGEVKGRITKRVVSSAGMARKVVSRYVATLHSPSFDLTPEAALRATADYAEAEWQVACRRKGAIVSTRPWK